MKKKIINNLARRLLKKYPRLYKGMGTKQVKKVLSGVFGKKVFNPAESTDNFSATV
jgi:hypothetical protein